MLRRRRLAFPTTYKQNAVVMANYFSQVVPSRLKRFKNRDKIVWDDFVMHVDGNRAVVFGTLDRSRRCILVPKLQVSPLVIIEASILSWCFTIYDPNITAVSRGEQQVGFGFFRVRGSGFGFYDVKTQTHLLYAFGFGFGWAGCECVWVRIQFQVSNFECICFF